MKHVFPDGTEDRIHDLRVAIKKLRALLRLMRPEVSKEVFLREDLKLKRAASRMAPYRDAVVIRKTLKRALQDCRGKTRKQLAPWIKSIRAGLKDLPEQKGGGSGLDQATVAIQTIESFTQWGRVISRKVAADPVRLKRGLKWTYGKARKKLRQALETRDAGDFHEGRMWIKWLFLQLQAVESRVPRGLAALLGPLEKLQEDLGKHHDAHMALEFIQAAGEPPLEKKYVEELATALKHRGKKFERRAQKSSDLFASSPQMFVSAMG